MQRALAAVRLAQTADELRVAQAALLPLLGLSIELTAQAIGRKRHWVTRNRVRYLRAEDAQPSPLARGGRRNQLVSRESEVDLVKRAIISSRAGWDKTIRGELRFLLAKVTRRDPAESTLTAILARVAPVLLPGADISELSYCAGGLLNVWKAQRDLDLMRPRPRVK